MFPMSNAASQEFGTEWLNSKSSAILMVPSIIMLFSSRLTS